MRIEDVILESEKQAVKAFLQTFKLAFDEDIEETIVLRDAERLIGTASVSANIIKCVAVDLDYQGENLLSTLISELLRRLRQRNIHHSFVYTTDEQAPRFKALGFKPIVQTMTSALLEIGGTIETRLQALKTAFSLSQSPKGCVVVNANPLTLGHLHLIKTAAAHHDETLVFVVSEDRSIFPFDVRYKIVKAACQSIKGVTVLPTLNYLVSAATFPKYFLKSETKIREEHALMDVLIFKAYYMKQFNLVVRYMGEEPLSPMTDVYNQTMKKYLNSQCQIVSRLTLDSQPISASTVRKLLKRKGLDAIKPYVPAATYDFLCTPAGLKLIEQLKDHGNRH